MTLLWRIPEEYPEECIGTYDKVASFDRFLLKRGQPISVTESRPVVRFAVTAERLRAYDCLSNTAQVPLISGRLLGALQELCGCDFQAIPALVVATNTHMEDFAFLNVTTAIKAIDHARSTYTFVPGTKEIMSFRQLHYVPGCLGTRHLARDIEYRPHLLVSDEVFSLVRRLHANGVALLSAEEIQW